MRITARPREGLHLTGVGGLSAGSSRGYAESVTRAAGPFADRPKIARRVDERAEKIEKRYEKRLGKAEEEDKRVKLEEERRKELDRLEMEWRACRERFEKVQRRKNEKRPTNVH